MLRYYKNVSSDGELKSIGTGIGGTEITQEEYLAELFTIREKADWVNRVFHGTAELSAVPTEWQEEVERRVSERVAAEADPEVTEEEALAELMEVLSE